MPPDPAPTTTDVPIIRTDEIVTLARAGHRAALRSVLARVVLAGEQGRAALDGAFAVLAADEPYTGPEDDEPLVVLLQCCPHPWRTTSGACTVCHTVLPARIASLRPTETTTMPDPGETGDPFTDPARPVRPQVRWNFGSGSLPAMNSRSLPNLPTAGSFGRPVTGGPRVETAMADALLYVRTELGRVDPKAAGFLSLALGLLVASLTVLVAGRLPGPAAAALWAVFGQHAAALVLITAASRPRLGGNFGFCRWAALSGPADVLADITAAATATEAEQLHAASTQLFWLSRAVTAKHLHLRRAQVLLVTGMATGGLAAALALLTR